MKKVFTVTNILIIINVAIFVLEELSGGSTNTMVALNFGAMYTPFFIMQPRRAFSAMFLHFGIVHLGMNMISLYNIGPSIEYLMGKWKYLIIYLVSGIFGNLLVFGVESYTGNVTIGAGASGAIFGILGAWLAFVIFFSDKLRGKVDVRQLGMSVFFALLPGFIISEISLTAHIGGLIGGFLVCYAFLASKKNIYEDD